MGCQPERRSATRLSAEGGSADVGEAPSWIIRPRLAEMMHTAVRNPLTVITAPAGSGKSVLLRQWAGEHRTSPVASVTFHPGDDAPRIAAQLFAAAARLGAVAGAPIPGGIPESHHALGGAFADALAAWLEPIGPAVLVIEAIDAVREPALTSELGRMLLGIPKEVHVVLTRRSASPAWLQREQLRGELASIDAADLAFTAAELHGVVSQFAGVDLEAAQVS